MIRRFLVVCILFLPAFSLWGEDIRFVLAGTLELSLDKPEGSSIQLSPIDSAVIVLDSDTRFFRGVELEFTAPASYLPYQGSLAIVLYTAVKSAPDARIPESGVADIPVRQLSFAPLPNKIHTVYQIPVRKNHGLRTSPYVTVPVDAVVPGDFPLIFRLLPVMKGLSDEFETMRFTLNAKPILSDEGEVKISVRYPAELKDKPFTLLMDDILVENLDEGRLLKEGEHQLVILSDDYRNENRRFIVERNKVMELSVELKDPTPLVIFEVPENTQVFFNDMPIKNPHIPIPVEPGEHQVMFQVGDYSLIKPLTVLRGKTYKVSLTIDAQAIEVE